MLIIILVFSTEVDTILQHILYFVTIGTDLLLLQATFVK